MQFSDLDKFSQDFVSAFLNKRGGDTKVQEGRQVNYCHLEIKKKWARNLPFIYKRKDMKQPGILVRANPDGSEDEVKLVIPQKAVSAKSIYFRKRRVLANAGEGYLYKTIAD